MMEWITVLGIIRKMRYTEAMRLADEAGVARGTMAKLFRGATADPRISTVEALERVIRSKVG